LTDSRPSTGDCASVGERFNGSEMAIVRPKKERNKDTREAHRAKIAELRLKGWSQSAIAQELGVTQQLISLELKTLRKQWQEEQRVATQELITEQFLRLENIIHDSLRAWEESQREQVVTTIEQGETPKGLVNKVVTRKSHAPGNPQYLAAALQAMAQINQIAGIPAWTKVQELNGAFDCLTREGYVVSLPEGAKLIGESDTNE